jgi:hypothetical protein
VPEGEHIANRETRRHLYCMMGVGVWSFFCYRWRKMVSVNFLSCDSLCSSLSVGKDTSHNPEGVEEHITAY